VGGGAVAVKNKDSDGEKARLAKTAKNMTKKGQPAVIQVEELWRYVPGVPAAMGQPLGPGVTPPKEGINTQHTQAPYKPKHAPTS
jgi:hypothetical protein